MDLHDKKKKKSVLSVSVSQCVRCSGIVHTGPLNRKKVLPLVCSPRLSVPIAPERHLLFKQMRLKTDGDAPVRVSHVCARGHLLIPLHTS